MPENHFPETEQSIEKIGKCGTSESLSHDRRDEKSTQEARRRIAADGSSYRLRKRKEGGVPRARDGFPGAGATRLDGWAGEAGTGQKGKRERARTKEESSESGRARIRKAGRHETAPAAACPGNVVISARLCEAAPDGKASREARPRVLEGGRIMDTTCDIGTCGTRHSFRIRSRADRKESGSKGARVARPSRRRAGVPQLPRSPCPAGNGSERVSCVSVSRPRQCGFGDGYQGRVAGGYPP